MRLNAYIAGVGMTRFMKYPDKGLKELGSEAVRAAVTDAGLVLTDLEAAYVGNCAAGLVTGPPHAPLHSSRLQDEGHSTRL